MVFHILTLLSVWTREGSYYDSVNKVTRGNDETLHRLRTFQQITQGHRLERLRLLKLCLLLLRHYIIVDEGLSNWATPTAKFKDDDATACISCLSYVCLAEVPRLIVICLADAVSTGLYRFFATRSKTSVSLYWCCPHFTEFRQFSEHRTSWSPRVILQVSQVQSHVCSFRFRMFRKVHWNVLPVNNPVHAWQS